MTQDIKDVLNLALDALDNLMYWDNGKPDYDEAREAIAAIKEALAQPEQDHIPDARKMVTEQEPVACIYKNYLFMAHEFQSGQVPVDSQPLYTHPPQRTEKKI